MAAAGPARILLCAAPPAGGDLCPLLEGAGFAVGRFDPGGAEVPAPENYDLVVLDAGPGSGEALALCRRLKGQLGEAFVPLLLVAGDASPAARLAGLEAGADAYLLRPFAPGELLAQARAFLRLKERHDRLSEKTAEVHRVNQRLQRAYQLIDQELELARRIQRSLLPQSLPELPRLRFGVHYRTCGRVGGDFYDVFRLDENHLGFYVADAMGHGVPASLLTIFVKRGVRPKDIFGKEYRLVPPGEVLQRLNRDLLDQALSENPFITMAYVLLNHQDGTLHFARSGHPYPLYVPRDGEPELWKVEGSLLGVFDTAFPVQTQKLKPGDKVLLYTDGIDKARFEDQPEGPRSLAAGAARYRKVPVQELVDRLAVELFPEGKQEDDLTLLGAELIGGE